MELYHFLSHFMGRKIYTFLVLKTRQKDLEVATSAARRTPSVLERGAHVKQFSQTPKLSEQFSQRPQIIAARRRSAATMSAFYCYFFLGLQISICFVSDVCHVIFYCLTRDTEDSYTAMRIPSTTNSRILEMAIVGQPFSL